MGEPLGGAQPPPEPREPWRVAGFCGGGGGRLGEESTVPDTQESRLFCGWGMGRGKLRTNTGRMETERDTERQTQRDQESPIQRPREKDTER